MVGAWIGILAIAVAVGVVIYSRPKLLVSYADKFDLTHYDADTKSRYRILMIGLRNRPSVLPFPRGEAKGCELVVTYLNSERKMLLGRPRGAVVDRGGGSNDPYTIDLPAGHENRTVPIALKYEGETQVYAWDELNFKHPPNGFKPGQGQDTFLAPGERYFVDAYASDGQTRSETTRFLVRNEGGRLEGFTIEELKRGQWLASQ